MHVNYHTRAGPQASLAVDGPPGHRAVSVRGMTLPLPAQKDSTSWMYPAVEPFHTQMLPVGDGHTLYVEESGNPNGIPVVFVHGGPGGGTSPRARSFFDPHRYRIILFDQRGCGKSTPYASLTANTTGDLVADMERIRQTLKVERWLVFGGSWGSTLGLAYAQAHPQRVTGIILRGIFLGRKAEIDWVYTHGTVSTLFPEGWEAFVAPIPPAQRGDLLRAYHHIFTNADPTTRLAAARAWCVWETRLSHLVATPEILKEAEEEHDALACAVLEAHYFVNRCFLSSDTQLLDGVDHIRNIPAVIIQGRYDLVCPLQSAFDLHRAWPQADFQVIANSGHSALEPNTTRALVAATDRFAWLLAR